MKTPKNMFLAKLWDFENFRLFDIDTPIDDFWSKSRKKFFFLKNARKW